MGQNKIRRTTITDVPRNGCCDADKFSLLAYEKGLEAFLRGAETPITIALQGEWGSGKTSLMNVLRDNLCGEGIDSGTYFPIWINTWEYSLMRDSNEALLQILLKMSKDVIGYSSSVGRELACSIFNGIVGLGSAVLKGVANNYANGLGDGIEEALTNNTENSIANLRNDLQKQIDECITKHPEKKGFIFFIDDLDRIDPPVAVELLELLKNIFTLNKCIFVLAIDYDVVIKGLKPKFGELNEKNEREFRSFFDKIIQVPFSMPVSQYTTKKYVIEELKEIGILSSEDEHNQKLIQNIVKAETLTIGPNPRSIKRFLNTLSLIKCINVAREELSKSSDNTDDKDLQTLSIFLNVAIVGIQVAYPKIYKMLCMEPGFTTWNDQIAAKMGVPRLDDETKRRIGSIDAFDEEWEQILYRICLTDKYLQNNALSISQLFNLLRTEILSVSQIDPVDIDTDEDRKASVDSIIHGYIFAELSKSSITGFSANDASPLAEYDAGQLMRDVQSQLCQHVRKIFKDVEFYTPRVKYNGGIRTKGYSDLQIWQSTTHNHSMILFEFRIGTCQRLQSEFPQLLPATLPSSYTCEKIEDIKDMQTDIFEGYLKELRKVERSDCYKLWAERRILTNGKFHFSLNFNVTFNNHEAFLESRTIQTMKEVTEIFFDICFKVAKMK